MLGRRWMLLSCLRVAILLSPLAAAGAFPTRAGAQLRQGIVDRELGFTLHLPAGLVPRQDGEGSPSHASHAFDYQAESGASCSASA
ncbi:MAG: hypothetical protein QGG36_02380 [Pirellulaceae bacterium]|jgi:hypothetical protein|nr:hypothetical protein [Pirellulaceae bacterium]